MSGRKNFLLAVLLISYAICAGDDDCLAITKRVQCYECSTRNDKSCGDPFNASEAQSKLARCDGACVKWVSKDPKHGWINITRTCSTKLDLKMHIALVCMKESRPGDGHMCFCNSNKCNSASNIKPVGSLVVVLAVVVAATFVSFPTTYPRPQKNLPEGEVETVQEVAGMAQNNSPSFTARSIYRASVQLRDTDLLNTMQRTQGES